MMCSSATSNKLRCMFSSRQSSEWLTLSLFLISRWASCTRAEQATELIALGTRIGREKLGPCTLRARQRSRPKAFAHTAL